MSLALADIDEYEAAKCRASFRHYVARAWREIDPAPFIPNWHSDAISDHLQAVTEGQIQRLIINISPGMAKSMICGVLWPSWTWIKRPSWQLLGASYEVQLATRDAVKARELMRGEWYTRWFRGPSKPFSGEPWEFTDDQDLKQYYKNTEFGHRLALGVGGKGTGYRGHALLIDDPISARDAHSKLARETCVKWKDETMSSRFNDKAKAMEVLIMQRLHEEDLTGHLLRKGGYEHLKIPARYEAKTPCKTSLPVTKIFPGTETGWLSDVKVKTTWEDPRTEEGESMFPALLSEPVMISLAKDVGSYGFAGQYQQRPAPAEGGILKREWFRRRWLMPGEAALTGLDTRPLPESFDQLAVFVDASFKDTAKSDFVAIGLVGIKHPDVYLLKLIWDRLSFTATVAALQGLVKNVKGVQGIYIEDKANGPAIIDTLKGKLAGLIPIEPDGGKEARIHAAAPFIEAGNFWLPQTGAQVEDFITEATSFPKAPHDDAIDMVTYALLRFCGRNRFALWDALGRS